MTHGPEVRPIGLQAIAGPRDDQYPLDPLSGDNERMLGYFIKQELANAPSGSPPVATLLLQVVVDPSDLAFPIPTKPIGPFYTEADAHRLATERGWPIVRDGNYWRRTVPSLRPLEILQVQVIECLLSQRVIVICPGAGGIPVMRREDGNLFRVDAAVDEDLASALLARQVGDAVYVNWRTAAQKAIAMAGLGALDPASFELGSMRPKVEAAIEFVAQTGRPASIGGLEDLASILEGAAGTILDASHVGLRLRT